MPAVAPKNALAIGAGRLYHAPIGTALPSFAVVGSVFTDITWTGWSLIGVTKNGHALNYNLSVAEIAAEEYLDPVQYVTTGRTSGMTFEMMQITATGIRKMLNAGTGSIATSGATTTLMTTVTPPATGAEIRCMIGWQSENDDERVIAQQAFQVGNLAIARRKGADNATLPVEFRFELDPSGNPFLYYSAGTLRG